MGKTVKYLISLWSVFPPGPGGLPSNSGGKGQGFFGSNFRFNLSKDTNNRDNDKKERGWIFGRINPLKIAGFEWQLRFSWLSFSLTLGLSFFGYFLIVLGISGITAGDWFIGGGLVLAGTMLADIASFVWQQWAMDHFLAGKTVAEVMLRPKLSVNTTMTLKELKEAHLLEQAGGILPVVEEGYLCGLLRPSELKKVSPKDSESRRVQDVMLRRGEITVFTASKDAREAYREMVERNVGLAAVLNEDRTFAGLIQFAGIQNKIDLWSSLKDLTGSKRSPQA